jgi:Trp operon repressor
MARLTREVVAVRENLVRELFRAGKSPKEVNETLKTEHGHVMRGKRLYDLRKEVLGAKEEA